MSRAGSLTGAVTSCISAVTVSTAKSNSSTTSTLHFRTNLPADDGGLGYIDPETGVFIESRFHRSTGESEANLTGLVTTETGIMTAAPYRAIDACSLDFRGHWHENGDIFGAASLHERCSGGASGHETDKMSPPPPAGTQLLAKGLNPDEGGAEIVIFETESGGAVFSVGSITWPASILVDPAISTITRNVIKRFLDPSSAP